MARDFTKNTSNYITLGTATINGLINGASAVSIHAWVNIDTTTTGANDNRVFNAQINGESTGLGLFISNVTASRVVRLAARSVAGDSIQGRNATTDLTTGTWQSVGGVANFGADTITPYSNGVAENGGAATFANSTYTPGTPTDEDVFSGDGVPPSGTTSQFDGRIAELAIWNIDIGADGFAQLAKGVSALFVRPEGLVLYKQVMGRYSPEIDLISGKTGTIVGTVANSAHPRIYMPFRSKALWWSVVGGDVSYNASVINAAAALISPNKTLRLDPTTLTGTASVQASVPTVRMDPSTLVSAASVISPSLIISPNIEVPVLGITASVQTPVHQVLMTPAVISVSAAQQALQEKKVTKDASVVTATATIPTPIPEIIKQLSELSTTASLIAPSVSISGDINYIAPVLTTTATVNTPTGVISKEISVILASAGVETPGKLVSKDIASIVANAQIQLPSTLIQQDVVASAPTLTAVAIVTSTSVVVSGPSIGDTIVYTESLEDQVILDEALSASEVYDDEITTPASDSNSITDEVIYDEGTQWGGGEI